MSERIDEEDDRTRIATPVQDPPVESDVPDTAQSPRALAIPASEAAVQIRSTLAWKPGEHHEVRIVSPSMLAHAVVSSPEEAADAIKDVAYGKAAALRAKCINDAAAAGISVIRVRAKSKQPVDKDWTKSPSPPQEKLLKWAEAGNIGFRTGNASAGLVIIDIDAGADPSFLRSLPTTVTVTTGKWDPSNPTVSVQAYFRTGARIVNSTSSLADQVDVRAEGGQGIAPGSIHPDTGAMYDWLPGHALGEVPIAELPDRVLEILNPPSKAPLQTAVTAPPIRTWVDEVPDELKEAAAEQVLAAAAPAIGGDGGDKQTFIVACRLVRGCGLSGDKAMTFMQRYNANCLPPWTEPQLAHKIAKAEEARRASPPESLGIDLATCGAEVVQALGLQLASKEGNVVLTLEQKSRSFTPAKARRGLENQYLTELKALFPALPNAVLNAASKSLSTEKPLPAEPQPEPDAMDVAELELQSTPAEIRSEADAWLRSANLLDLLIDAAQGLGHDCRNRRPQVAAILIGGLMRLTGSSAHIIVMGKSGTGKTHLVNTVCSLQPPEFLVRMTAMSPKALVRRSKESLKNRVVQLGERVRDDGDGDGNVTSMIRQFISDNEYVYEVVTTRDGSAARDRFHIVGPTSFVETTTSRNIFAEDESRMLKVTLPSSVQLSESICGFLLDCAAGQPNTQQSAERLRRVAWTVFRQLKPRKVVIPREASGDEIKQVVDMRAPDAPRAFEKILSMVKAHALLHQFRRETDSQGCLVATKEDVLAVVPIVTALQQLETARDLDGHVQNLALLYAGTGKPNFEVCDVVTHCCTKTKTANRWITEWTRHGLAKQTQPASGSAAAKHSLTPTGLSFVEGGVTL